MDAGHGGKSERTAAIEEIAFDYAFALKIAGISKYYQKNILLNLFLLNRNKFLSL